MEPRKLLEILDVAERLKDATRHCYTRNGRRESVAEHCWMMTLMAMFLREEFPDVDMNKVIDINTKGTMCMMRAVTAEMTKTGYGSIVNVASVAGVMGCGGAAYVASKAAVIGLTRHTALRFAGTNVRCNAICPGTIVTPMVADMNPANMDMNIFGQMMKHNDLKVQPCMPEDVANMLLFFASDESRAITGQSIVTDFGSTL